MKEIYFELRLEFVNDNEHWLIILHIFSYFHGVVPYGDVKYVAEQSLTCLPLILPLVPVT
jgi:hypothetical protein